ncbi:MAG: F0F1 ATP synthase subunit B [Fimbriimonadaceae bacterium]|nr:F0F1 ATP synthase subunit B [Fimbriimonadaceae bacterium]
MSQEQKSSGSPIPGIVIGIVLMVGGVYLSGLTQESAVIKDLEAKGIPLNPGVTVAAIGVFLMLFPVINLFFIKPLHEAINERNESLERTFAEAESLRSEMETMRGDYERRLAASELAAREQIQSEIKKAQDLRAALTTEATQRADALVSRAQAEIESEKAKVVQELRTHVVDMALAAAEKVIGENMNDERNRRLVEEFVNTVEVVK